MGSVPSLSSHAFTGRADLHAMEAAMSAAWTGPRRPLIPGTPGDLEWWTAGGGPDADWPARIRIWELRGEVIGWAWFNPPGGLDWFVSDRASSDEERVIRTEILDWLAERARAIRAAEPSAEPTEPTEPIRLETWAGDGWSEEAILQTRGWTPTDTTLTQHIQALDIELDPPRVPDGYILRSVRGPAEIAARVEVHRAAFAPSRMTVEKYRILETLDRYRFDHDIVLEAADGTFAAFAICWLDPIGSIGEFEPVGTHPDHQRRGLGKVIMRHGLRLMRAAGMRDALVFSLASNRASEALYRAAGFRPVAVHRRHTLELDP